MANIQGYEAPSGLALSPTEIGIDAHLQNARRLGAFGNQIADTKNQEGRELASSITDVGSVVENYMTHREVSAGAAEGAKFIAQKNDEWNQLAKTADPNDVTVKQKFIEENLNPALDQFKSGFNTARSSDWAEHFIDQYRQHMEAKTSADMSTLAGIAVRKNVATTVNSLSSAVASDPSSLDFALKSVDHSIGAMVESSPNIDATTAASVKAEVGLKAKENIVKSAISGMIAKNPNIDLDAIQKKYGDYIDGAEMKTFARAAQAQAKANLYYDKQIGILQRQQADLDVHQGATKVMTDNISIGPDGSPIIKPEFFKQTLDLARNNPNAPSAASTVRTMLDWGESQQNKGLKAVDDPGTVKGLSDNLFSPDKATTTLDLMKARAAGKISDHTFTVMNGLVKEMQQTPLQGPIYQDTMKAVHSALVLTGVGIPGKDDVGEKKYAQFVQNFIPQYLSAYRAGTLPPNALDVSDPKSMISQAMEPFKRGLTDRINDYISTLGGAGGPAAPKQITTKAEYDALKVGTIYIGKDGQKYEKR